MISSNKNSGEWRAYDRAADLACQGQYQRAQQAYRQLADSKPQGDLQSLIQNDLGVLSYLMGDSAAACEELQAVIEEDPQCQPARENLVIIQQQPAQSQSDTPEAVQQSDIEQSAGTSKGNADIYGFMHVAMIGNWGPVLLEQFELLHASGLFARSKRIFVNLLGSQPEQFPYSDSKIEIINVDRGMVEFEMPILRYLHQVCRDEECLVWYIHTKGVSSGASNPSVHDWRRLMQHFVIERHQECIDALKTHDICGVNWSTAPWPHFSGNFWWAQSQYIRSLDTVSIGLPSDRTNGLQEPAVDRHFAEQWIGTGREIKIKTFHQSNINHYHEPYPRSRYVFQDVPGSPQHEKREAPNDVITEIHETQVRMCESEIPHVLELLGNDYFTKPVLLTAKGPSLDRYKSEYGDIYDIVSVNQACDFVHPRLGVFIDYEAFLAIRLEIEFDVAMPLHFHWCSKPCERRLEDQIVFDHRLRRPHERGRLFSYDLEHYQAGAYPQYSPIRAQTTVSEAAVHILSLTGVKTIYTLGLDGGAGRASMFDSSGQENDYSQQHARIMNLAQQMNVQLIPL